MWGCRRATASILWFMTFAAAAAAADPTASAPRGPLNRPRPEVPLLKISAFRDIEAYLLTQVQKNLQGTLDVQLKWVRNADEAHADIRGGNADLAYMSYDDTLSIALQEMGPRNPRRDDVVLAAWPAHGSIVSLCGTIDITAGLKYVGIDTDTGYARMLREQLKKQLSPADYAAIVWVYAGATNLRYEQLKAQAINATLLNPPFTSFLDPNVPCQPFYNLTGLVQGVVGNVRRSTLASWRGRTMMRTFLNNIKNVTLDMRNNQAAAVAGLSQFYNVTAAVASKVYSSLWGVDGIQTSFCFEQGRLRNVERIFAANTGLTVPASQWWVLDWGCTNRTR